MKKRGSIRLFFFFFGIVTCALANAAIRPTGFSFVNGPSATLATRKNSVPSFLTALLAVNDNTGTTLTWSVSTAPVHGTLGGFPVSAVSNGGTVSPSGAWYQPLSGYSGPDVFKIDVSDGATTSSIIINVTVSSPPSLPLFTQSSILVYAGQTGVEYTVVADPLGNSYNWIYFGSGVTIYSNNTNAMTMDFSNLATSGTLYVQITGPCGNSPYRSLNITVLHPMPVTLTAFSAQQKGTAALVKWTTATEENSAFFDVERSLDGQHFTAVGRVASAGKSGEVKQYYFSDSSVPGGLVYYRLKQVDIDGKTAYSQVRTFRLTSGNELFSVYPNPVSNSAAPLQLVGLTAGHYTISIYTSTGQLTAKKEATFTGSGNLSLGALPLSKGIYLLQVQNEKTVMTTRLIKE